MADASYVAASMLWALYGFVLGFEVGFLARLVWTNYLRK